MPRQAVEVAVPEAARSVKAADNSFFGICGQVNSSSTVNSRILFMGSQGAKATGTLSGRSQSDQLGIPKNPTALGRQGKGKIEEVPLHSREETIERLRQLVADKTSTGSIMLAKSRLY